MPTMIAIMIPVSDDVNPEPKEIYLLWGGVATRKAKIFLRLRIH